jgi:hypothetical protein
MEGMRLRAKLSPVSCSSRSFERDPVDEVPVIAERNDQVGGPREETTPVNIFDEVGARRLENGTNGLARKGGAGRHEAGNPQIQIFLREPQVSLNLLWQPSVTVQKAMRAGSRIIPPVDDKIIYHVLDV